MAVERKGGYQRVLALSLAGLFSGSVTSCLVSPTGRLGGYVLGAVFGAVLALCLELYGTLHGRGRGIWLPFAAAVAYYLSILVAAGVELSLPWQNWSMGQPAGHSGIAIFAGGFIGGSLLLGTTLFLVHPKIGMRILALKAAYWSLAAGVLGVIGWELGPSLGMAIWSGVHRLGLTAPTETFQNALHGETSHQYSLFVVWQTGMALVIGLMLRDSLAKAEPKELG